MRAEQPLEATEKLQNFSQAASKEIAKSKEANSPQQQKKKRPRTDIQRQIFKITLCVSCLILIPYALTAARLYNYIHSQESGINSSEYPTLSNMWMTATSTLFFFLLKSSVRLLRPCTDRIVAKLQSDGVTKVPEAERIATAHKIEYHIYCFSSYSLLTVLGYFVVRDRDWLPSYLGGHGQFENCFRNMPLMEVDPIVFYYGLFSFGLRLESLISHLFLEERSGDFEEMLLHDAVTVFLFGGYLFSNSLAFGTQIVILHDASDILFHFSKAVNASSLPDELAGLPFILGQFIFAYLRLYCFP